MVNENKIAKMPQIFHGFNVVNLKFRLDESTVVQRQIFIQEHSVRRPNDDKPVGRTLFAVNIPPYVHESDLKSAFSRIGDIESVHLVESVVESNTIANVATDVSSNSISKASKYFSRTNPINKFKAAYIVYKSTKLLRQALQLSELDVTVTTGIAKWRAEYDATWVDEKELEAEVNEYMAAFETSEQEAKVVAKKLEVDEDGWVTVKRGKSSGGGFEQKWSTLKALEEKIAKGKKKKEFKNFYTFQLRESKYKHIVSLRKRFQDDRVKIEALKNSRRLKPF